MNLFIKMHPRTIALLREDGAIALIQCDTNPTKTGAMLRRALTELNQVDAIYVEKPFLKMLGEDQRALARSIIHIQRTFGVLLYVVSMVYGHDAHHLNSQDIIQEVYGRDKISKDTKLSECDAILHRTPQNSFTALDKLCIHDCLIQRTYIRKQHE